MRTIESGAEFAVEDLPALHWMLGLLFLGVGSVFVLGPLGLFDSLDELTWLHRGASLVMGACGVAAGLWVLRESPRSRLVLSRALGRVRITRTGIQGRSTSEWPASDIVEVQVRQRKDDEGADVFQIQVVLGNGRAEPVSHLWTHSREEALGCARRLSEALRVPLTSNESVGTRDWGSTLPG